MVHSRSSGPQHPAGLLVCSSASTGHPKQFPLVLLGDRSAVVVETGAAEWGGEVEPGTQDLIDRSDG
jgi:hypothetical protein